MTCCTANNWIFGSSWTTFNLFIYIRIGRRYIKHCWKSSMIYSHTLFIVIKMCIFLSVTFYYSRNSMERSIKVHRHSSNWIIELEISYKFIHRFVEFYSCFLYKCKWILSEVGCRNSLKITQIWFNVKIINAPKFFKYLQDSLECFNENYEIFL